MLKDMFGLSGKVIEWFRSYLEQRSQTVSVHGILSDIHFSLSCVPQILVLWFSQCIARRYGVKYHYASPLP